jgi:hypothetical protein
MRASMSLLMIVQLSGNVGSIPTPTLRCSLSFPMLLHAGTFSRICMYLRCKKELISVELPPQDRTQVSHEILSQL